MIMKFRCWDKEVKAWVTYFEINQDGEVGHPDYDGNFYRVDEYVLMRSTGILDRRGIEIYESDILLWEKSQGKTKVICRWDYYSLNQYVMYNSFIEVIGNLHENPGLEVNR